jgi:hypothetical protein
VWLTRWEYRCAAHRTRFYRLERTLFMVR